jgi:nickel transport protein
MNILIARCSVLAAAICLFPFSSSRAYEFISKPAQLRVESGAKLPFNIFATRVFMISEEVEPVETVKAGLVEREKSTPVDVKENRTLETLDGVVTLNRKGTAGLVGRLQEPIETIKTDQSSRIQRIKREKFSKALIGVSWGNHGYKKIFGHKLEIVPESKITKTRVGDEIAFKILLDSKPLKSPVYATYAGFSRRSMTFAYTTECLDDGVAYIKVTSPGVCMVRVEKSIEANAKEIDLLSLKETLVFSVQ